MGLVVGEWRFPPGTTPGVPAIAEALARATGLEIRREGPGEDGALRVPTLRERLFDWRIDDAAVTVHGFVPPHPYLWEMLDLVMSSLGGRIGEAVHLWRPDPAHAALRRPWQALTPAERVILRLPTLGAWRPLDRLLARRAF
jgi:hypothetical protein